METCRTRPWSRVVREWIPLGLILVAYWQIDWFAGTALTRWQQVWLGWDRWILETMGLRAAVECAGGVLPGVLELVYFCLYFIPPACLFVLYATGRRARIGRFLTTALLGTFLAYALLPHFPSVSPLAAYPGLDLPHYSNLFRTLNGWFHANLDIATSVFPSGHVAVAFSAAFGLLRALPERRRLAVPFFAAAGLVLVATVYCRYHYAADGLASVAVSAFAWRASALLERYV
jgi:membrane-associated phospholipid phosphatase